MEEARLRLSRPRARRIHCLRGQCKHAPQRGRPVTSATTLTHKFVDSFPTELQRGVVYVSTKFASAAHSCCCGCGLEVVTPLSPVRWQLMFDGRSLSLSTSIGNWAMPCRSHYWIRDNTVHWAGAWSQEKVQKARARDRRDLDDDKAFSRGRSLTDTSRTPLGQG